MFADYVKMGAKLALIAGVTAAIIVLFNTVQIPALNYAPIMNGVRTAVAIIYHWVPGSDVVIPIAALMLTFQLSMVLFEYAMIAIRWVFKVNE